MRGCGREPSGFHAAILAAASWLAPSDLRNDWLQEWTAELWYLAGERGRRTGVSATPFCLGAFRDALWLRAQRLQVQMCELAHLRGPGQCLGVLAAATGAALLLAWNLSSVRESMSRQPVPPYLVILGVALLIVHGTATLEAGPHSSANHREGAVGRIRWWTFLGFKIGLVTAAVFLGASDLGALISRSGLQPHVMLVGLVLAYRWALDDQRKRCPKCLRRLGDPIRIGDPAGTLLEWYGTEFVCSRGHGFMQMPELARSSYCETRWVPLDASWQHLFQ